MKVSLQILLILLLPAFAFGQNVPLPEINAASAILIDYETSTVLFEKNADEAIPPASMTKLMTIYTALGFVGRGEAELSAAVPISKNADFRSLPPRSSLMFIEQGQNVSLLELLQGLALPSGNDAAIAVAEYLAGSVENFVALMNMTALELGLGSTEFHDASGLSEENRTTARDFAAFCRSYIERCSDYLEVLHLPSDFTYPKESNIPPGDKSVYGPITQPNHNLLIGRLAWADGLKTGFIDESGYNFAATAEKDGRRLVLVTMGGPGSGSNDGSLKRALDAAVLFSYGFFAWAEYTPEPPSGEQLRVHGGTRDLLGITYSRPAPILMQTARIPELGFSAVYREISLPVSQGEQIGRWELFLGDSVIESGLLFAAEDMQRGNVFRRLLDR